MTVDEISDFFAETIYVFNRSEMRQRLNNFRYEMSKANLKYVKMRILNEPMEVILSSYSVIYADYLTYYKILGWFKDYLDESVKNEFANNDIIRNPYMVSNGIIKRASIVFFFEQHQ